jgi:hypothetical protein
MLFPGNVLHLDEEIYISLIKFFFSSIFYENALVCPTRFPIPDYIFFKQNRNSKKIKINSFIPIPHPFPSLFFPFLSLPQSYFEMVRLYSLFYFEFFYSFPCFFLIYHCFPPATYIGPFPFFIPLFVPVKHFPSIFFDPFHQSLPLCIFQLAFGLFFPIPPLLFAIFCSFFSYSPVEVPSQEYTIFPVFFHCVFDTSSCCLHLFTVLYCHYFPPFISYMNFFAMHLSSSPFSCRFSLILNFTPVIISPGSSFLFLFSFCPLTFPVVLFR